LHEVEQEAARVLEPQLRDHLVLTTTAFNLVGPLLSRAASGPLESLPRSLQVAIKLLLRLANDLRCVQILSIRGYPLQAAILVASLYEVAFTIAFVGRDDDLAQAWLDHDDPTTPFRDAWTLTRAVIVELGIPEPDAQTRKFYRVYRQLCLAKHANPLLESRLGAELRGDVVMHSNGPDTSENAIRVAWFTLQNATGLALIALENFLRSHLNHCSAEDLSALVDALEAIGIERERLAAAAVARWGNEDPFIGRW